MPWSCFVSYMLANQTAIPTRVWREIREAGKLRLIERQQAGRADAALDFADLVERAERSIEPRS